jgi:hypothetical protein
VICEPSAEIVAVPVDVPVPSDPASVSVYDSVCPEIVADAESFPTTPLSHSPESPVKAPGAPSIRTTLDLSAVTAEPFWVKFASTTMLLAGLTFECATICHCPCTVAFELAGGVVVTGGVDVAEPPPHPDEAITKARRKRNCEADERRSFI